MNWDNVSRVSVNFRPKKSCGVWEVYKARLSTTSCFTLLFCNFHKTPLLNDSVLMKRNRKTVYVAIFYSRFLSVFAVCAWTRRRNRGGKVLWSKWNGEEVINGKTFKFKSLQQRWAFTTIKSERKHCVDWERSNVLFMCKCSRYSG